MPTPASPPALDALVAELARIAADHGISRVGVAPAEVMTRARTELFDRRERGLHDGMQFTYRNPVRSTDPQAAVPGAQAVFVGARPYADEDVEIIPPSGRVSGRVARYARHDHYGQLRAGLWAVAHRLRAEGWKAVAFADDNAMVDREIAYLAGLGWFGKNANLLLEGAGSWFVLGSVVTDAPLPVNPHPVGDGCGSCRRCLDGCPTGAIIAPGVVDAGRCLAWILQKPGMIDVAWRTVLGDRIYGCDDCQEVCPPTVRLGARHRGVAPVVDQADDGPWVDIVDMLDASDTEILQRWGRWYVTGRQARWVRRNALVVLANAAPGAAPDTGPDTGPDTAPELAPGTGPDTGRSAPSGVVRVIGEYLRHTDPYLRAHAVWAARRWGLDTLLPEADPDPLVSAELARPVSEPHHPGAS